MLAKLELVSFHIAVGAIATISFLFLQIVFGITRGFSPVQIYSALLLYCGVVTFFVSLASRAYSLARWNGVVRHRAAIVILLGHIGGPVWFMSTASYPSGIAAIPPILLSLLFYPVGIIWSLMLLGRAPQPGGQQDAAR